MAGIGSEAFAVFDGFQVIHLARVCVSVGVDRDPHGDLGIDAAVVAIGFDGLRNQKNSDAEQAEAADCSQHRVSVGSHHFTHRELLLVVIVHVLIAIAQAYERPFGSFGLNERGSQPKPRPAAWTGSPAIRNSM